MRQEEHERFTRDGGRAYNICFSPPLSTFVDQAVKVERRSYREVFRHAMEIYLRDRYPEFFAEKEIGDV